jgi:hypothetical protein
MDSCINAVNYDPECQTEKGGPKAALSLVDR